MFCRLVIVAVACAALAGPLAALGKTPLTPAAAGLLRQYLAELRKQDAAFAGFDAARGRALFVSAHPGPAGARRGCTTCHMQDPTREGRSDVGKTIAPLAPSANAQRFTNPEDTEKWFHRNCRWVLGRTCTTQEKGDFITFLFSLP